MVDQFLTQKVVVNIKAQIQTNGDLWKDNVKVRLTLGRRGERRTVQGGGIDVLPGEIISAGEFEVPLTTDVIETVTPPVNPDSISYWIYQILVNGVFPEITVIYTGENRDGDTVPLTFTAIVTEVVPMEKEEVSSSTDQPCIVRIIPKTLTSFIRV